MLLLAAIAAIAAFYLGRWRCLCAIYEEQEPFQLPSAWRNPTVRTVTWLITASLSIFFAFILARWVQENVGDFIGKFSFGVFLVLRWQASIYAAVMQKEAYERRRL